MYPDTFEGFKVESSATWTTFHRREVSLLPLFSSSRAELEKLC